MAFENTILEIYCLLKYLAIINYMSQSPYLISLPPRLVLRPRLLLIWGIHFIYVLLLRWIWGGNGGGFCLFPLLLLLLLLIKKYLFFILMIFSVFFLWCGFQLILLYHLSLLFELCFYYINGIFWKRCSSCEDFPAFTTSTTFIVITTLLVLLPHISQNRL